MLKDLEFANNRIEDCEKQVKRNNNKDAKEEMELLLKAKAQLEKNKWIRHGDWSAKEILLLNTHKFITAKSVSYLINLSEEDFLNKKNKWLRKIKEFIDTNVPG